jgi:uncharacterized protein Yka (UPF0111/DUF47 family)
LFALSTVEAALISDELWPYIYVIFVISLCAIAIGYWFIVHDEVKRRPIARERIASLAKAVDEMADFARPEFKERLSVCEDLFQRKYYDRCLKLADKALGEAEELNGITKQLETEIITTTSKMQRAREVGLEIDEDGIGLAQLMRDLKRG